MKFIRFIFITIMLLSGLLGTAQNSSQREKIYLIDGHFFNNLNELSIQPADLKGVYPLGTADGTPDGAVVSGLSLNAPLSENDIAKALPMSEIPEAEQLIDRLAFHESLANRKIYIAGSEDDPIKPGTLFPEFKATDVNGNVWTNDSVKGKVMVLNLWQTACGPCRREMPELSTWKDEMPDVMFFSATWESAKLARPVLEKHGFNWIPLVDNRQFSQWISPNYGYPVTIIVGKDGKIAMTEHGTSSEKRAALKAKIEELR